MSEPATELTVSHVPVVGVHASFQSTMPSTTAELSAVVVRLWLGAPLPLPAAYAPTPALPEYRPTQNPHGSVLPLRVAETVPDDEATAVAVYTYTPPLPL